MKTIAIIAEFNPLHNGHVRLLQKARKESGAAHVIILMSGDYVQRGEPALFDKYVRTRMALEAGADLVLELPAAVSCGSARRFAEGAAALLRGLGVVSELWFGSESGSIEPFLQMAAYLAEEPEDYRLALQQAQAEGLTFPAAREKALLSLQVPDSCLALIREPNNILGLEYCLALARSGVQARSGAPLRPRTIARKGDGYHDASLSDEELPSSSALRRHLLEGFSLAELRSRIPASLYPVYEEALRDSVPIRADDFSAMLQYQLLKEDRMSLTGYLDVPYDLAGRILQCRPGFTTFSGFCDAVKTRERTRAQISRALLHILLGITEEDLQKALAPSFVRMLGFRRQSQELLSSIQKEGQIRLVSKPSALSEESYERDLFASDLYESVRAGRSGTPFIPEYSHPVIVL